MRRKRLPRYVYKETTRHGKDAFYFRGPDRVRVRLPDEASPDFAEACEAAANGSAVPLYRETPLDLRRQKVEAALRVFLKRARSRCAKDGLPFDLDLDWLLAKADSQNHRCALTGIEFFCRHTAAGRKNPFVVSADRISAGGGYTRDNVRLVVFAVNLMLLDWGEEVFWQVVRSFQAMRRIEQNVWSSSRTKIPVRRRKRKLQRLQRVS